MPNKEKISVIIPSFNEARVIGETVNQVANFFYTESRPCEIIVVDDGSADDTAKIAAAAGARVLKNETNHGKGYSVKTGVNAAGGELILFTDADLSTPIEEVIKLESYLADYDIVIASRAVNGANIEINQSAARRLRGKMGNRLVRLFLGLPFADTQCGFKLFKRKTLGIFARQTLDRFGFDFELLFIAKKMGYNVKEVGVRWRNDATSTVRAGDYFKTLAEVFKVRWNDRQGKYK